MPLTKPHTSMLPVGASAGTVCAGDDSRVVGAAQKSSNLSDMVASTVRTNLGLGGSALLSVGTAAGTVCAGDDVRLDAIPALAVTVQSSNYTMPQSMDVVLCDATGTAFAVTLPAVAGMVRKRIDIKKTDASVNKVTVTRAGSALIDGQTTYVIALQYQSITLMCDGTNWNIL